MAAHHVPEGYHSVTPYLVVDGAEEAIRFYERAFGAVAVVRMPMGDGRLAHAEIRIGDSFVMLADAGRYGLATQIIASLRHRDKSPNNALMAKAVALCAEKKLPYLVYAYWTDDTLAEFKRHCGFEPMRLPRYWVPLTRKGRVALALGLHHGWKALLPDPLKTRLKALRQRWYEPTRG